MPEPVSRYHGALLRGRGRRRRPSSSAARRRACRSCRRARRTAPSRPRSSSAPRAMSLPPATFAGSRLRPDQHEVVVHDVAALDAVALGDELAPRRPGRARTPRRHRRAAPMSSAWPVPSATTRTSMPVFFCEDRQQVAEQARLLGRGRRRDGDELLLRLAQAPRARQPRRAASREDDATVQFHGSSPLRKAAASAVRGAGEEARRGARSASRPSCRNSDLVAEAPRLAEVVRDHDDLGAARRGSLDDRDSISRVAPGSRLAVGSSRNSTSGLERPGAREREPLLLAAGQHARRTVREMREADALERSPRASVALRRARRRRAASAYATFASAERRSITGRWNTIACRRAPFASLAGAPLDPARGRRQQPVAEAQQHALARRRSARG